MNYEYPLLIKQLLHTAMLTSKDQEIVSGEKFRYTYREFRDRIGQLANGLSSLGVKHGDTVAVMNWDDHRYLECFFSIPMMGATLHTINIRLSSEQILFTINHAQDDVILVHVDFLPVLESIADRISRPMKIVVLAESDDAVQTSLEIDQDYEVLLQSNHSGFKFEDFDEQTRATTFYTTGTTGDPKGVAYSHRQLVLHTMGLFSGFGLAAGSNRFHKEDVYMPITPLFHVHGWGFPYAATCLGVKQVYPGKYDPDTLLRLIDTEKVTFSHCVPTILHMLLNAPRITKTDLSSWKVVIGGAALPEGLTQTALDLGIDIFAAYGLSETCPVLTVANVPVGSAASDSIELRSKTGAPVPLVDLRVVDANMNDVLSDGMSTGEVVVRTPWLTQEYTHNKPGTESLWQGGYLHTGDVGYLDSNGTLQITDRIKDVIKSGGEWLSSLELENIISKYAGVSEVAVIGVPDNKWGERPIAIVVKADQANNVTVENIQETVKSETESGHLPKWAIPERVEFVQEIEKTSVGKIDKKRLREIFG